MKRFFQRVIQSFSRRGYEARLIEISKILGLERGLERTSDMEIFQNQFIDFVSSTRQGCILDWRERWGGIKEALTEITTADEAALIESIEATTPDRPKENVARLKAEMVRAGLSRYPVELDSYGDFSHLLLVPISKVRAIEEAAGGWLIG